MTKPLVAITGASSGIGAGVARVFSKAGYPLLLTARRVDLLRDLDLPRTMCRQHDVADAEGYAAIVDEAEAEFGPVDLLVNNAGYMALNEVRFQSPEDWRRQFEVNCVGLLNTTHAVLPRMVERRGGTIINLGSTAGRNVYENHTVYCATKHAVHAITEGLRREVAALGVRVLLISPGMVESELLSSTESEEIKADYRAYRDQIGGALAPADIGEAMRFAYEQRQQLAIWELVVAPTGQLV
ncbi:SDR family oxidoreductase [Nocardioides sp.]|uniref:SDR family oxidoreductase n=1 Tax=Nocardioides sp. TaxID=35761 RepID=UPI0026062002|nr:SDR family oxidoreductase [Nocardioides sp.]MCW2736862.1 oxidoreductase [Nocardioides sp.]